MLAVIHDVALKDPSGGGVIEQIDIAQISREAGFCAVAGSLLDFVCGRTCYCGGGGEARAERVARECGRIVSGRLDAVLYDSIDSLARNTLAENVAMFVDSNKDWPVGDRRECEPIPQRRDRTMPSASKRHSDLTASPLLIRLASADADEYAFPCELHVIDIKGDQFRTTCGHGKPKKQQCTVPHILWSIPKPVECRKQIVAEQSRCLPLCHAECSADAAHRGLHNLSPAWIGSIAGTMGFRDRSETTLDSGNGIVSGHF
jgi:hypothetical protein